MAFDGSESFLLQGVDIIDPLASFEKFRLGGVFPNRNTLPQYHNGVKVQIDIPEPSSSSDIRLLEYIENARDVEIFSYYGNEPVYTRSSRGYGQFCLTANEDGIQTLRWVYGVGVLVSLYGFNDEFLLDIEIEPNSKDVTFESIVEAFFPRKQSEASTI